MKCNMGKKQNSSFRPQIWGVFGDYLGNIFQFLIKTYAVELAAAVLMRGPHSIRWDSSLELHH